ncbi:tetratricopeptide repeat-containing diguanylate cyclase [Kangiella shandongensis]|uniref:tetratricopeptide repeat-containing diguanylate cyclase n=1 Tax=Kangiella shandongensis TaxID=2763258 RepID=UPI001CBC8B39|nr:tetratricopeptide repeat-containing diguanylate cyclase [Kangiella shandongensis]
MSNLSVPERKQEAFFLKISNLLNKPDLDNHSEALANILMANYQILNGEAIRAREYMSVAEPLVKTVDQPMLQNQYDYVNIFVLRSEGDLVTALEESERLYNEVKDKWGLNKLGDLVLEQAYISAILSRYQESIPLLELALDYSLEANDPYLISETYNVFGILYSFLNDNQSAIMYFKKAVEVMERHPALVSNIYFYANLADSYRMNKEYEKSLELIEKARKLAIKEGDIPLRAFAHQVKARVYTNTKEYESAIEELELAKRLQEQVGEQLFGYELQTDFAYAYLKLGQIDQAEKHLDEAIDSAAKVAALDDFYLKRLRSEISAARDDFEDAYKLLQESYETYRKTFNDNLTYVSNLSREQLDQERLSFENKLLEKENQINTKYVKKYKKYSVILVVLIALMLILLVISLWLLMKYRKAARKNEEMALTDNLTDLPNRRQMFRQLEQEHEKSEDGRSVYSLIIFDIDHFKTINDRFGHRMGDKVINRLASITRHTLRQKDTIGRISGEEFLIILPDTNVKEAKQIAERLNHQFANADFSDLDDGIHLTASFGVTEYMLEDESLDMVINRADRLLYKAKSQGRNRVVSTFNDTQQES